MTDIDKLRRQLEEVSGHLQSLSPEERSELMERMDLNEPMASIEPGRRRFLLGLGAVSAGQGELERALSSVIEPTASEDVPTRAVGTITGTVNGVDVNADLDSTIDPATGRVDNTISPVPNALKGLTSLTSNVTVICSSTAVEQDEALNFYHLTGGNMTRNMTVTYDTGEVLNMVHEAGYTGGGTMDVTAELNGEIPDIDVSQTVTVDDYTEEYTQTDPTTIDGVSDRVYYIDGRRFTYQWVPSVDYDGSEQLPFPETHEVTDIDVGYDEANEELHIAMTNVMRPTN